MRRWFRPTESGGQPPPSENQEAKAEEKLKAEIERLLKLLDEREQTIEQLTREVERLGSGERFPITLTFSQGEDIIKDIAHWLKANHPAFKFVPQEDCIRNAKDICAALVRSGKFNLEQFGQDSDIERL